MERSRISCAKGNLNDAETYYKKAISLVPQGSNPHYDGGYGVPASFSGQIASLADCFAQQNQYERAKTLFLQAISTQPDGGYQWGLAELYIKSRKYEDAELLLLKLLANATGNPKMMFRENLRTPQEILFMLGKAYEGNNELTNAEHCYIKSLNLSKNSSTYPYKLMEMGKFYLRLNNTTKAKQLVDLAISERMEKSTLKALSASELECLAEIASVEKKPELANKLFLETLRKYDSSVAIKEKIDTEIKYMEFLRKLNRKEEAESLSKKVKDDQLHLKQLEFERGYVFNVYK